LFPNPYCPYFDSKLAPQCSYDNAYQPSIEKADFLAFSNFYYAFTNTAKLLDIYGQFDVETFENATSVICNSSFDQLKRLNIANNAEISENFLTNLCFSNVLLLNMADRYGFKNFNNFKATDKVYKFMYSIFDLFVLMLFFIKIIKPLGKWIQLELGIRLFD
jgi:hypothetical protein